MERHDLERARAGWQYRGSTRPPFAVEPGPRQESVWDYPRPPRVDPDSRSVRVRYEGTIIAESTDAVRVLETASPPVFYLPPGDARMDLLDRQGGGSICEWKGSATYWALSHRGVYLPNAGWSYEDPFEGFEAIRGYLGFYPAKLECYVGTHRVEPQPGGFYGGWVTPEIVGPFKGEAGTAGW